MEYFFRTVLIITIIIIAFKGFGLLNKKLDRKILKDIKKYFEAINFKVIDIRPADSKKDNNIPFNLNEWTPSTSRFGFGKNYYLNKFWKVRLKDKNGRDIIKWVNTGHFFAYQIYFIVKDN